MASPIRIHYLAPCSPSEKSFGTQLRTSQVFRILQKLGEVDFTVVTHADQASGASAAGMGLVHRSIELRPVPPRSPWEQLRCKLDPRYVGYYGYTVSEKDRLTVLNELPNYDLVWLHNLRTANVFNHWKWPRSVMDLDDIPSSFLQSVSQKGRSARERWRARLQQPIARRREHLLAERFDVLTVCSDADQKKLGFDRRVHVIPNGFPKPDRVPSRQIASPPRIGFIGVFDYLPNAEGIQWFARECWPLIQRQIPHARLRLVGAGSDGPTQPKGAGIDALGWVKDVADEIATWSAMIVPVRLGAGTRVKIADGFSRKCPIVSTSLGAYGYDVVDQREIHLADSAQDFANACVKTIREPAAATAMAERAWDRFLAQWTWDAIQPRVQAAAEDCLRRQDTGRR